MWVSNLGWTQQSSFWSRQRAVGYSWPGSHIWSLSRGAWNNWGLFSGGSSPYSRLARACPHGGECVPQCTSRGCRASCSWGLGLVQCHFCHILLVRVEYAFPEIRKKQRGTQSFPGMGEAANYVWHFWELTRPITVRTSWLLSSLKHAEVECATVKLLLNLWQLPSLCSLLKPNGRTCLIGKWQGKLRCYIKGTVRGLVHIKHFHHYHWTLSPTLPPLLLNTTSIITINTIGFCHVLGTLLRTWDSEHKASALEEGGIWGRDRHVGESV